MTEHAKKLLLLYYKQSRKIRRVSGLPPLTFKAKKAGTLKNYRIYGQTVDGESVGDRTGNLFDKTRNTIPDAILDAGAIYAVGGVGGYLIYAPINPLQTYTFSTNGTIRLGLRSAFTINKPAVSVSYVIDGVNTHINHNANKEFTRQAPLNANWIVIQIRDESALAYDNMLNSGSTALPYEPYGYKIPLTLTADSAETTDIYLDEPLAKSGNNADYIDYAAQKRHNSDGTESSVTLPEISTLAGTNVLSVGTEAQPSDIYLKGKIKKKPKIYYKIYYYSQDGQTALSTETVEEGHDCTYSTVPTKESDTDFNYTFTGWSTTTNSTTATAGATENIQQNTNLYAAFSKSFKTDTISDSWEEIIANCDNGTYASKYQIGDLKTIDVGTEGPVQMQIVAIDTDLLASDNTKKAPITWISKQLLNTDKVMNGTSANYLSDWTNCDMRTYLKNTVLPMLPSVVQNNIKEVTKYTNQRTGSTTFTTISSTEDIWLPSYREISNNTSNCETSGVQYNSIFTDDASRVKSKVGNRANIWWTRSASGSSYDTSSHDFARVSGSGIAGRAGSYCTGSCGVAIGFCT